MLYSHSDNRIKCLRKNVFDLYTVIEPHLMNSFSKINETMRRIRYHLYNLKNVKNTDGGVLLLVNLHASVCNVTKCDTPQ